MSDNITIIARRAQYPGNIADELGALQAQIAELRKTERDLKDALIGTGEKTVEGQFFKVNVSKIASSTPVDYKAAFLALVPKTRQAQAADYTKFVSGGYRIVARAKSTASIRQGEVA